MILLLLLPLSFSSVHDSSSFSHYFPIHKTSFFSLWLSNFIVVTYSCKFPFDGSLHLSPSSSFFCSFSTVGTLPPLCSFPSSSSSSSRDPYYVWWCLFPLQSLSQFFLFEWQSWGFQVRLSRSPSPLRMSLSRVILYEWYSMPFEGITRKVWMV